MSGRIDMDFSISELLNRYVADCETAVNLTLVDILDDIEMYVPHDTGELTDSAVIDEDTGSIVWEAEHAPYVYDMPKSNNFQRDVHWRATSEWVDEAIGGFETEWVKKFEENLGGVYRG